MSAQRNINPVTNGQKAKIHIAIQQLNISDQQYRDILSGFNNSEGKSCNSCTELNFDQAETLLRLFVKLGWKKKIREKPLKYESFANRDSRFATPEQMRRIDAIWNTSSKVREKTEEAMNKFIKRIAGVDHISFLLATDVHKIIKAIQGL
ncbi:MAG TPA: regulatory protein GemA [Ignavibacteriaceae bacterium]|nr:regulatory protein GemA [Ignavibacteriaceae bacterium]